MVRKTCGASTTVRVYVLCYDEASEQHAREAWAGRPWATVVRLPDAPETSRYMEGAAFLDVLPKLRHEWEHVDYVGTLSWRAAEKIAVDADLPSICAAAKGDVVALLPSIEPTVVYAAKNHPRFLEVWVPLLLALGYAAEDAVSHKIPNFFCNYWLATPRWMDAYLSFYRRAVKVLDTERSIQDALWSDSGYSTKLSKERLRQIYGRDWFPYHPFVCERLPCFFFWKEGASVILAPLGRARFWQTVYEWEARSVKIRAGLFQRKFGARP